MSVKKKHIAIQVDSKLIDEIINSGAKTVSESTDNQDDDVRFTLRIPNFLIDGIDEKRKTKFGKISRNQWILQAISEKLEE